MPSNTLAVAVAAFRLLFGEHACRIAISHVSRRWDNEKGFGNLDILVISAFWTDDKNGVALYSSSSKLQMGECDG